MKCYFWEAIYTTLPSPVKGVFYLITGFSFRFHLSKFGPRFNMLHIHPFTVIFQTSIFILWRVFSTQNSKTKEEWFLFVGAGLCSSHGDDVFFSFGGGGGGEVSM